MRFTYLLSSAFLGGFLSRTDEKRPKTWFARLKIPQPQQLPSDVQEHLANAAKIVCTKINQDVTTLNTKNLSPWRKALQTFIALWKALFAHAGARVLTPVKAMPILLMCSNASMSSCLNYMLSKLWLETLNQFTTRENRYRGIKSRPKWSVLEEMEYHCVAERGGFAVGNPAHDPEKGVASANSVKAANLQDFLEESISLRFASEFFSESNRDSEEFMDQVLKRKEKAKKSRKVAKAQKDADSGPAAAKQAIDSYTMSAWTEDAEVGGGEMSYVTQLSRESCRFPDYAS